MITSVPWWLGAVTPFSWAQTKPPFYCIPVSWYLLLLNLHPFAILGSPGSEGIGFSGWGFGAFVWSVGICTLIISLVFLGGTLTLLGVWLVCDSCLSSGSSVSQVPAVNFALRAFFRNVALYAFAGLCHGMRFCIAWDVDAVSEWNFWGQSPVNSDTWFSINVLSVHWTYIFLSNTYRISAVNNWIVTYASVNPYFMCIYEKNCKADSTKLNTGIIHRA